MLVLSKPITYLVRNRNLIARFGLVGISTFFLNYCCVWLFYGLIALDYRFAVTLAYIITVVAHFLLNRMFTYNKGESHIIGHIGRYGVMLAINYAITISVSIATVEVCGLSPYIGVIFATGATACSSFFLMKDFVFSYGA
jgi:putative flippase GtrA